jgi:putative solute:sodium symporter small subunit
LLHRNKGKKLWIEGFPRRAARYDPLRKVTSLPPFDQADRGRGWGQAKQISLEERRVATNDNEQRHWGATTRLTVLMLVIWVVFSFIIHMFAPTLNGTKVAGFPLGYYMAAQGSLIVFVAILFWFAYAQDKVDRDHGVAEDE